MKNCIISNFQHGVFFNNADGSSIINVSSIDNKDYGFYLKYSDGGLISNSIAKGNARGIYLYSGNPNTVQSSTFDSNSLYGVYASLGKHSLNYNRICSNGNRDVYSASSTALTGDENQCATTYNYNDAGTGKCTRAC